MQIYTMISAMGMSSLSAPSQPASPAWQGRSIATQKLRLVEFSAFVEQQRDPEAYNKHTFVEIGGAVSYTDPLLEVIIHRSVAFLRCII